MAMNNPYAKYANNAVFTATQEELTLMLYDGALKFINQAIVAIENKDLEKAHTLIVRIQDIVREFQITLKLEYEISKYFSVMYDYMYRLLVEANTKKDIAKLEEVRELMREFRDTWKDAMKVARAGASSANQ